MIVGAHDSFESPQSSAIDIGAIGHLAEIDLQTITHRNVTRFTHRLSTVLAAIALIGVLPAFSQPVISNLVVSDTTMHTVTVSWDTDVAAKTRIELARAGEDWEFVLEDGAFNTSHSFTLDILEVIAKPNDDYRMMSGSSYDFRVRSIDATDDTASSATQNVLTTSFGGGALPAGWSSQDVGGTVSVGSSSYNASNGMWQVRGGGNQIYQDLDSFHYLYSDVEGDFDFVAQVRSYAGYLQRFTKAGNLFRGQLTKAGQMFTQSINYNGGDFLFYREFEDSVHVDIITSDLQPAAGDSIWIKLERRGNDFSQYYGDDGVNWTVHGPASTNVPLPSVGYVGVPTVSKFKPILSEIFYSDISLTELTDTTDPIISNVVTTADMDTLIVEWETNENTDSKVEWGLTVAYGNEEVKTDYVADHKIILSNLQEGVYYHYRIVVKDFGGNIVEDIDRFYTYGLLPVEMTFFTAVTDGQDVQLKWATASEQGNSGFDVEHRVGETYTKLGFVDGAGTTSEETNYSFRVEDLEPGTHYFRLRQINNDGSSTYSAEVEATIELDRSYRLTASYPNPFHPRSSFTLTVGKTQDVEIGVYNLVGQKVATLFDEKLQANEISQHTIDGTSLPSGVYIVRVAGEFFTDSQKVMLVR